MTRETLLALNLKIDKMFTLGIWYIELFSENFSLSGPVLDEVREKALVCRSVVF